MRNYSKILLFKIKKTRENSLLVCQTNNNLVQNKQTSIKKCLILCRCIKLSDIIFLSEILLEDVEHKQQITVKFQDLYTIRLTQKTLKK